jgi:UDP-N-acetylglucosamine 2-epimerase (non-hydrolysing)
MQKIKSMKRRVLLIFGTRPEAIKMASLYYALIENGEWEVAVCVTAQHRDMLDQVLDVYNIKPLFDLDLMRPNQGLADLTSRIVKGVEGVISTWRPWLILVHGDTTTCFASSLAAFYNQVLIGHVEAGLRTHDTSNPFPEEFNRQAVSRIASVNFAPSDAAAQNLILEGINRNRVIVTGNTVIDSMLLILNRLDSNKTERELVEGRIDKSAKFNWRNNRYVIVTCHRRENHGVGIENVCKAIVRLAKDFPEIRFVLPVHKNPKVLQVVNTLLAGFKNVILIDALGYSEMLLFIRGCYFIMTDSGGLQEEAPCLGKPVLLLRNNTERPESVEAGGVRIVGTSLEKIVDEASKLITSADEYMSMSHAANPYGNGDACQKIISGLRSLHNNKRLDLSF